MTTLAITPNWKNKTAKFKGTIAAGEHVAVSISNDDGYVSDASTLRLRVVDPTNGKTLAQFPMPEEDGEDEVLPSSETPAEGEVDWASDLTPLYCILNLNTVQMLKAVPPAANVPLLFVLDDYDNKTLYFKEQFEVTHWPRRFGEEEPAPTDLDDYKDIIEDFNTRLTAAEQTVADAAANAQSAANSASAAAASAATAATAATDAQTGAIASKNAAQTAANDAASAKTAAEDAQDAAENAQEAAETAQGKAQEYAQAAAESAAAFVVDDTLSVEGAAADAKAVGEANQDLITQIGTVQDNLDAETTARETLDGAVQADRQNLANEIARAQGAEQTLDANKADKSTTYTKTEVDAKVAGVQAFQKYLVDELPDADEADMKGLYLVPTGETSEEGDLCEEWTVVEEDGEKRWEKIGGTTVDLDNYYDKVDVDGLLAGKLNKNGGTMTGGLTVPNLTVGSREAGSAVGVNSVAEGSSNTASGSYSHAEGSYTEASGDSSHAEGSLTTASGDSSHAEGIGTVAGNNNEHAQGRYNASHTGETDSEKTLSSIGFGADSEDRKNAVETMRDGKTFIYGLGNYDGTNPTSSTDLAGVMNSKQDALTAQQLANIAAVPGKLDKSGGIADNLLICGTNEAIKFDDSFLYMYRKINGAWVVQNVWDLRTSQDGVVAFLSDIYAAVQQIAPAFTAKTYAANNLCTYDGVVYRCKMGYTATASSATPNADTTHWEAKTVSALFLPLTGGTMTGPFKYDTGGVAFKFAYSGGDWQYYIEQTMLGGTAKRIWLPLYDKTGTLALAAANPTAGNLAALDAQGNPVDSQIPKTDVALKSELRYSLINPTVTTGTDDTDPQNPITYGAVTLVDRAANFIQFTSDIDELRITLPAGVDGKVRDFGLAVNVNSGVTPPAITILGNTAIYNPDGTMPELAEGMNLLYFSEIGPYGLMLVKGEQVQQITQ